MKVHVWGRDVEISEVLRAHVERHIGLALARFGERIGQVTVRISGTGVEKCCRIDVDLRPRKLRIEDTDADPVRAIDYATARASSSVARALERERELEERGVRAEGFVR